MKITKNLAKNVLIAAGATTILSLGGANITNAAGESLITATTPETVIIYNMTPDEYSAAFAAGMFSGTIEPNNGVETATVKSDELLSARVAVPDDGTVVLCMWAGVTLTDRDPGENVINEMNSDLLHSENLSSGDETGEVETKIDLSSLNTSKYAGVWLHCNDFPKGTTLDIINNNPTNIKANYLSAAAWKIDDTSVVEPTAPPIDSGDTTDDNSGAAAAPDDQVDNTIHDQSNDTAGVPDSGFATIFANPFIVGAFGFILAGAVFLLTRRARNLAKRIND